MSQGSSDSRARLDALTAEVATLREQLSRLKAELDARAGLPRTRQSMRTLLECPHCQGRRVYHVKEVLDRGDGNIKQPFSVSTKGFWAPKPIGRFSCWVCAGCGFAEWYVQDPRSLDTDVDHVEIHEVDDKDHGPYR
ncbi:MAG TPA: hypothetical protein ENK57_13045 [Polyangiaceae bacterium]|nr:hypothetical protein [Polyangiaceae bacterium]